MKSTLLATMLFLAATTACSARHGYVGPRGGGYYGPAPMMIYGPPPPPPPMYRPPMPGRGFVWVAGYWHPAGRSYQWRPGAWVRPPRPGMIWVAPRYSGNRYHGGYWRR